jgi:hypothetical protein
MKYETYNCAVRHNGNLLHEVPLTGITSKELVLLKAIHGADAIVRVVKTEQVVEREEQEELFRIAEKYGSRDDAEAMARSRQRVERLFSVTLNGFDDWLNNRIEDSQQEREEKREMHAAEVAAMKKQDQRQPAPAR